MLEDPKLDPDALKAALRSAYGIEASAMAFVPGYDAHAATYRVDGADDRLFLKVRFDALREATLDVPAALLEAGVPNVLAPIRTQSSALWAPMEGRSIVLYPFVSGSNAMDAGMTEEQWRTFGTTLRAVHDSDLEGRFAGSLPTEAFSSAASASAERMLALAERTSFESVAATRFADLLATQAGRIGAMLMRFEELAGALRERPLGRVLCHADIHAANILVTDDGGIMLVDWDGPMLAPRERDLLFVIGSRIARDVEPHEEAWFFAGYGDVAVDPDALIYYRYERVLEDIAEFASSVLLDDIQAEATRDGQTQLVASFFAPGGILETAERV